MGDRKGGLCLGMCDGHTYEADGKFATVQGIVITTYQARVIKQYTYTTIHSPRRSRRQVTWKTSSSSLSSSGSDLFKVGHRVQIVLLGKVLLTRGSLS